MVKVIEIKTKVTRKYYCSKMKKDIILSIITIEIFFFIQLLLMQNWPCIKKGQMHFISNLFTVDFQTAVSLKKVIKLWLQL